jgi:hypothetical protein
MNRLRVAGYYIGIVVLVAQVTELVLAAWPARIHSPSWRITFVGGAANTVFMTLLVMFIMTSIAVVAVDRRFAFVMATLSALAAVTFLVLSGVFALDAIQMRNQVRQALADRYDFASAWVFARQIIGAVGFGILSVAAFRSARAIKPDAARPTPKGTGFIVGGLSAPRVEKPVEAPGA